ncbi:MAG: T9SS type A sorting domain-containing protein [Crocinitomicaceae bacterium]|nr:T9SS type A sorting domain-containing protein [Crocinitomicaceae bacterium]
MIKKLERFFSCGNSNEGMSIGRSIVLSVFLRTIFFVLITNCVFGQTTTITVYPDSVKYRVPLFGYNHIYPEKGGKLLNDDGTWNSDRKQAVLDLNPGWLRFPGGTIGNLYKWKNCVGPISDRYGMHGYLYKPTDNHYGPDEAAQLAEALGSELVIHVSANESGDYAADWVEYMNSEVGENLNGGIDYAAIRAQNGHPEPYNVKYWEIVNEGGNGLVWHRWKEEEDPHSGSGGVNSQQYSFTNSDFRAWGANGGDKSFYKYKAVTKDAWLNNYVKMTGIANEKRYTKLAPVVRDSVNVYVGANADSAVLWTLVDDFSNSSSTDKHYTLDEQLGEITFGDGTQGQIPSIGEYVYTDFAIENYDGYVQFQEKMKAIDSTIEIASGHHWMHQWFPALSDGYAAHGTYCNNTTLYPNDHFKKKLSRVLGGYRFKYYIKPSVSTPAWGTEIHGNANKWEKVYQNLFLYAQATTWGNKLTMIGPNYLLGDYAINAMHINYSTMGNVIQAGGWVTNLFTSHFGKTHVKSITSNMPTQIIEYQQADWLLSTVLQETLDKVYVTSSINEDSTKLYVMCVNTTSDETIESDVEIVIQDTLIALNNTVLLSSSDWDTPNTLSAPDITSIQTLTNPEFTNHSTISDYLFPPASATVFEFDLLEVDTNQTAGLFNKEEIFSNYTVFPNPAGSKLIIEGHNESVRSVSVYSLSGKEVTEQVKCNYLNEHKIALNLSNIVNGMYFLQIHTSNGCVMKKFIKE